MFQYLQTGVVIIVKPLQQLLHHFIPRFYYFKGFLIANLIKKSDCSQQKKTFWGFLQMFSHYVV